MLTEALLGAVSQAVIERVANVAELEERLRRWLGRDPAQLAFKKAFTRAYTAFARQYPELTASFFDEHFLTQHATPELTKLLSRTQHPDPAALAGLWAQQFCIQAPNIMPAVSDFLAWLKGELQAEEVFRPVFDSRALETLPALEAKLETLVQLLQQQARQAQQVANRYHIQTEGGPAIAGDVHTDGGDFIGRDQNIYNTYFQGDFATLDDYYVRPDAVFQRVKLEQFVGRAWLDTKVDAFLHNPKRKSGVLIVEGEAGVGKTSFLAHLVKERRYLHLFAEQLPGEANVGRAIQSLAAQLVARYRIEPYARRDAIPQNPSMFPDFLDRLLRLAVQGLAAGEQIVIVGDALDEAGSVAGGNVFGLPKVLPDNVYLILSQRPVQVPLSFTYAPTRLELKAGSPENIADVQSYLATVARRPAIAQQLQAYHYSESEFVRTLAAKSAGVWMYLLYVIDEIEQGERAPLNLEQLPASLAGYYAQYWRRWRYQMSQPQAYQLEAHPKWDSLYAPLLGALAAFQEPVTLTRLVAWAGVPATPPEVRRLLTEQWRAFISQQQTDATGEVRYRLYHLSLRDFITGRVSGELSLGESSLVEELRAQVTATHHRIVAQYQAQCNGQWERLVSVDNYARRYLATHLKEVEPQTLFDLVAHSDAWAKARDAIEESYAGYLTDLALAWQWIEQDNPTMVGQIRCALIKSSIHTLANNIPSNLLALAIKTNLWNATRAFAHITQISQEDRRVEALVSLVPYLPAELMREALAVVREIQQEDRRVEALVSLVPYLPAELMREALAVVREIQQEDRRVEALVSLVPYLPAELMREALAVARDLTGKYRRAKALHSLEPDLPAEEQQYIGERVLAVARELTDKYSRAYALSRLVPYLPAEQQQSIVEEALVVARELTDKFRRAEVLSCLVPYLPAEQQQSIIEEALALTRRIADEFGRAEVLSCLVPYLPAEQQQSVVEEALALTRRIADEFGRAYALSRLVPYLPAELMREALAVVREIQQEDRRMEALVSLVPYLPAELMREALAVVREIQQEDSRAYALSRLVPHLPAELMREALAVVREIQQEDRRVEALVSLVPYLPAEQQQSIVEEALAVAREIQQEDRRVEALVSLVPYLPAEQQQSVVEEALALTRRIADEFGRAYALVSLVPYLPAEQQQSIVEEALAVAREIQQEDSRAYALSRLVPYLPAEQQQSVVEEALALTRRIADEFGRAYALVSLVPYLPAELMREALAVVREIQQEDRRVEALVSLVPHLPAELMREALAVVREIQQEDRRVEALVSLVPYLPAEQQQSIVEEALAVACEIQKKNSRAYALRSLTPHLPSELQQSIVDEALAIAHEISDEDSRVKVLGSWFRYQMKRTQGRSARDSFLAIAKISDGYNRTQALSELVQLWQEFDCSGLDLDTWPELLRLLATRPRSHLLSDLSALLPVIHHLGGDEAIDELLHAIRDVSAWWP